MEHKLNFDELIPDLDTSVFDKPVIEEPIEKVITEEVVIDTKEEPEIIVDLEEKTSEETASETKEIEEAPQPNELATLFYKELVDNEIAVLEDGKEDYTWDDVSGVITNLKTELPKQITNEIIESTPELGRDLIDYIFTKKDDLNKDSLREFMNEYLGDLEKEEMTIEDDISARKYLTDVYKSQGLRESQIEVMLDVLEDDENDTALKDEAKKFLEKETSTRRSKETLDSAKAENKQIEQEKINFANDLNKEFSELDWDARRVNKIKDNLLTGKTNEVLTKASQSVKGLIQLANFADYFDEKTGEFNFDEFVKKASSKDAKSLKDKITRDMLNSGTRTRERAKNPNREALDSLIPISPLS